MGLRKRATSKAAETQKATMKIGFVGQIKLSAGVVARFAKAIHKPDCFVGYSDEAEQVTREAAIAAAKKVTGEDHTDMLPCLWVEVVPDTSLTPTSRYKGSFISLEAPGKNLRTHKEHGRFVFDHMSPEFDDIEDKKVWAHIAWVRLTEEYGGDLTLFGDDANDELSMVITHLGTKRAATDLVKALREGAMDMDALITARGYDAAGIRNKLKENASKAKGGEGAGGALPALTDIGEKTKQFHMTLDGFLEAKTVEFLKTNFQNTNGDVEATAEKCGADAGDVAIILNQPQYFKDLMAQTGKGEQEALVKVAKDTGLAHPADLAKLLGIEEAPF